MPPAPGMLTRTTPARTDGGRAGIRDVTAVPGQIAPELGRFAVDGDGGMGWGRMPPRQKRHFCALSAFFAPFCDDGSGPLRPSFDRRSPSKRIN